MTTLQDGTVEDHNDQGHVETTETTNERETRYKELQSAFTKTSQELAQIKKQSEQPASSEAEYDDAAIDQLFKSKQVVTKTELDNYFREKSNEEQFAKLAEYEPSLKQHESAIKRLAQLDGISIEEAIKQNNFLSSDKLERAKNARPIVGNSGIPDNKEKAIGEMTSAEWAARKAKHKGRR